MQQQNQSTGGFSSNVITSETLYIKFLENRQFTEEDAKALGLEYLTAEQTKKLIGHTAAASIRIPYFDLDGNETGFNRVRLLNPIGKMKYSQPRASGSHIYFPPTINWQTVIRDVDIPLIITEGEFKAWAITKAIDKDNSLYACLGLAGVTSWTDKHGLPLHKDLMQIMWRKKTSFESKSRTVYIIFDYDGAKEDGEPNAQVALAETQLAITLKGLGAEVHLCRVGKFGQGVGKKYAIDDHLAKGGTLDEVLTSVGAVITSGPNANTDLFEFSTKYAFLNGDVIRLRDGHIMSFQKAKIDSAQWVRTITAANGNVREVPMIEEYKKWSRRCDIQQVGIYPQYQGLRITPEGCYNYLNDWSYRPIDGDPTPYLEFCDYFFRDELEFAEYWHNWVANIIQTPHKRNYTTPQFVSAVEGIGKSAIAEFIAEMMGLGDGAPAAIIGPDELFGNFNGMLKNKVFIVVNEPSSDREDHSAKLKNYITSDEIAINNKYGAQYSVKNYLNFVFTSNKPYITHMGNTARREAIYSPVSLTNNETHPKVDALMKWARSDGFGIMLNWYYNRDISGFDCRAPAPKTKSREQAIALSRTPLENVANDIKDWVNENLNGSAAFSREQLSVIAEKLNGNDKVNVTYLHKALSSVGKIQLSKAIRIGGSTPRFTVFHVSPDHAIKAETQGYPELVKKTQAAIDQFLSEISRF